MGAQSFDDEIAQVPSRDGADWYFAPNMYISCLFILSGFRMFFVVYTGTMDNECEFFFFFLYIYIPYFL